MSWDQHFPVMALLALTAWTHTRGPSIVCISCPKLNAVIRPDGRVPTDQCPGPRLSSLPAGSYMVSFSSKNDLQSPVFLTTCLSECFRMHSWKSLRNSEVKWHYCFTAQREDKQFELIKKVQRLFRTYQVKEDAVTKPHTPQGGPYSASHVEKHSGNAFM